MHSKNVIFIIGQHRTGSTLLKNILDAHSDITMAFDEMNLFEPFRSNTLDRILKDNTIVADQLMEQIAEQKVYGTFWKDFEKAGFTFEELKNEISSQKPLKPQNVLFHILELLQKKNKTSFSGIKYPVHIQKVDFLTKYFSKSKIIFLTRNPKAIIASKLHDEATHLRKKKSVIHRFMIHYFTIAYFSIEYVMSIIVYFKKKGCLKLIRYEDLVLRQEKSISDICNWCEVPLEESMFQVTGKSSSHGVNGSQTLNTKSLEKYKQVLNRFDRALITVLTNYHYKKIKLESRTDL